MNVRLSTGKYEIVETGSVIIPSDDIFNLHLRV